MDKKLIFLVLLLIIILSIIFGILFFRNRSDSAPTESKLEVFLNDKNCESDADCIIIPTKCSSCGCGEPINKIYEDTYKDKFKKLCENYRGAMCEYCCPTIYIACINKICIVTNLTKEGVEVNPCG